MKNSQKGFIVPLGIIIIAVLAIGGGYYAYNKSHTTAVKTEVATNNTEVSNATTSTSQTQQNNNTKGAQTPAVSITEKDIVGYYKGSLSGDEYMAFSIEDDGSHRYDSWLHERPSESGKWSLSKTGTLTVTFDVPGEKPIVFSSVVKQGNKLILKGSTNGYDNTFTYLGKDALDAETASWKTYANTKYGFEIKYPVTGDVTDKGIDANGNNRFIVGLQSNSASLQRVLYIDVRKEFYRNECGKEGESVPPPVEVISSVSFAKNNVDGQGFYANEYCTIRNGYVYDLTSKLFFSANSTHTRSELENDILINQAINSFKFSK